MTHWISFASYSQRVEVSFKKLSNSLNILNTKGGKTMSDLAWKISKRLPVYIDFHTMKRILWPKTQGYTLAIWNCGSSESLWSIMRDVRITIRKDGRLYRTIKNGYV